MDYGASEYDFENRMVAPEYVPEDAEVEEDVYCRLKIMSVSLEGGYENNKKLN